MASFKLARSKITVFADPIEQEQPVKQNTVKRNLKYKRKLQDDNKENIDPFGKTIPNAQAGKSAFRSKNLAKTPVSALRQSSNISGHTPSPLADITEAHDSSYISPLPLSVAYSVDGVKLRRSERVAKRALQQQLMNEMGHNSSPLSTKEEGNLPAKPLRCASSKASGQQRRSNSSDFKTRALKVRKAEYGNNSSTDETNCRNTKNSQRIATTRNLRF